MTFLRIAIAILASSLLLLTSCTNKKEQELKQELDKVIEVSKAKAKEVERSLEQAKAQNAQLRKEITALETNMQMQDKRFEDLTIDVRGLVDTLEGIEKDRNAREEAERAKGGFGFWTWLLIIVALVVIGYIVYSMFFKSKPMDEEEDDMNDDYEDEAAYDDEEFADDKGDDSDGDKKA